MKYAALRGDGFAKAQKREERAMFRCYYEAIALAKMPGQRKNLELVRDNLIEGDRDLTISVYENFLQVCYELNVPGLEELLRTVKMHPKHPGMGNCYYIPSRDKDLPGHLKAMTARRNWRAKFRREFSDPEQAEFNRTLRLIQGGVS